MAKPAFEHRVMRQLYRAAGDEKHAQNTTETSPFCTDGVKKFESHPSNTALVEGLKRLKLSGARFAELIGKPERTVEEWTRGAARPSQESIILLDLIENCPPARARLEAANPRETKPRGKPFKKGKTT